MYCVVMPQSHGLGTLLPSLFTILLTKSTTAQSKNGSMNGKEAVMLKFYFMSKVSALYYIGLQSCNRCHKRKQHAVKFALSISCTEQSIQKLKMGERQKS
jgi:hypothetical protein